MVTTARALGRLFDIGLGIAPVNLNTGGNTGKRISMVDCGTLTIVVIAAVGTAASDLALDLQEHNAASGGTSQDLDIITQYFIKDELALDNDESWVSTTQAAASEISDAGGLGVSAEHEQIVVIEVGDSQLSDDFTHISLNVPQPGATKLGTVIYIKSDLEVKRTPANLPNLLNPGAANA